MRKELQDRNLLIREEFTAMWNDGMRIEVILDILAKKYYLRPNTILHICKSYGCYAGN